MTVADIDTLVNFVKNVWLDGGDGGNLIKKKGKTTINKFNDTSNNNNVFV